MYTGKSMVGGPVLITEVPGFQPILNPSPFAVHLPEIPAPSEGSQLQPGPGHGKDEAAGTELT